ncbi:hypothetical protein CF327_g6672 [Tilletia walkeri]|uniref:CFEM domain-containing protein n=1 Tax=Tilletia walkeri TaxID=117179 RepID=A0A8X7T2C1_9BASI|nr:hypothetical protein CF327_g6672 [Tilletia walkeri]KAE8266051.1 hypothetical protein A4X09_0g6297 [Tilletia walkeri]
MRFSNNVVFLFALAASASAQTNSSSSTPAQGSAQSPAQAVAAAQAAAAAAGDGTTNNYGTCAITCATQALPVAGCSALTDFPCFCNSQKFIDTAIGCVSSGCPEAFPIGVQAIKAICGANGQNMTNVVFPASITSANMTNSSTAGTGAPQKTPPKSGASASVAQLGGFALFITMAVPAGVAMFM